MSSTIQSHAPLDDPLDRDPFYYGWRDRIWQRPDGTWAYEQIPLTRDDVLHPQMGDHIVESSLHDLIILKNVIQTFSDLAGLFWNPGQFLHAGLREDHGKKTQGIGHIFS